MTHSDPSKKNCWGDRCFVYDELIPSVCLAQKYQASFCVQKIKHDSHAPALLFSKYYCVKTEMAVDAADTCTTYLGKRKHSLANKDLLSQL